MGHLIIGSIALPVDLPAEPLAEELWSHLQRVAGSRGEVVDWIEKRWGPITITPEILGPEDVALFVRDRSGARIPISQYELPPGGSDEIALGFVVGRLLCRGLLSADTVRHAPPLPSGRSLTELRGVEIASMPQALHEALEELHVIGFTGMPDGPSGAPLWIEGGPVLATHDPSAEELRAEIQELLARMAEKFRLSPHGPGRFGDVTLEAEIVATATLPGEAGANAIEGPEPVQATQAVKLSSRDWSRGYPDLPLLQWILIHLMRPRSRHVFLPMRPLLILPRTIPPAALLPTGDHLADLSAIRHQLMPAKIAQILGDLHRRGGDPKDVLGGSEQGGSHRTVELRFGPIRFPTARTDRETMLAEARSTVAPLIELFRTEGGGEAKYGPVTLDIQSRGSDTIDFVSAAFLPGCPDEILCEFLVASWLRNGTIPLSAVQRSRRIGRRTVVAAPTIQRQLAPSGTTDLIETIHSGRAGQDRRSSSWKYRVE